MSSLGEKSEMQSVALAEMQMGAHAETQAEVQLTSGYGLSQEIANSTDKVEASSAAGIAEIGDAKIEFSTSAMAGGMPIGAGATAVYGHLETIQEHQVMAFEEGEFIFKENDLLNGVYVLKSGCAKLFVNRDHSRGRTTSPEYVTKLVSAGEVFGYKSLVQNRAVNSYAKAVKSCIVWVYPREQMIKHLNEMPSIIKVMLEQAVADIHNLQKINQFHYLASVQERIAYQLVVLADRFGISSPRGIVLSLKLTRNEFAQLASTINESLSRHLTEFRSEGLIELDGKDITIVDRAKLLGKAGVAA